MAPQLIIFSGAGLSAESGLPTFRGDNGLWEGIPLDVVCNIDSWQRNFDAVHAFYDARRRAVGEAKPNAGHHAIAAWQKRWPGRVHLLTQNIDNLLEKAGCTGVIHLHGEARLMHCVACDHQWEIPAAVYDQSGCPVCGKTKTVKPGVVFFGQAAPHYQLLFEIARELRRQDTVVIVGTSGTVLPADRLFGEGPSHSILVNFEPGRGMDESSFSERRYGPATKILPELKETLANRMEA